MVFSSKEKLRQIVRIVYDVIIVGCGVAGCYISSKLSKRGVKVLAIEEHPKPGFPSKCTGLVSWRIKSFINFGDKIIQNTVKKAEFISPKGKKLIIHSKKPMYVIDRSKLDFLLYRKAIENGAEIKTKEKFLNFSYKKGCIEVETSKDIYCGKILVGTDGAYSKVASTAKLDQPDNLLYGVQATAEGKFEKDKVELWFGSKIAPGFFAWVVPISDTKAKVGLAVPEKPGIYFKKFMRKRVKKYKKPDTAGIIRFGKIKKSVSNRLLLVGDAASQVKPFSGGGIVYGLIASNIAVVAIRKALKLGKFDEEFFMEEYEKKWKEILFPAIGKGLLIRKLMYLFGDFSMNFSISLASSFLTKIEKMDVDLISRKNI